MGSKVFFNKTGDTFLERQPERSAPPQETVQFLPLGPGSKTPDSSPKIGHIPPKTTLLMGESDDQPMGFGGFSQFFFSGKVLGQSGNLCRGHLLVPQTVCRWEVHDIHVILAG